MQSDLISRSKLKQSMDREDGIIVNGYRYIRASAVLEKINTSPGVDAVEPTCGNWIGEGEGFADGYPVMDVWYCSNCNHCIDDGTDEPEYLPNYCPNCGAKMDAKEADSCE